MSITAGASRRVKTVLAESVYDNPVVTRDFRTRMRGVKAFSVMGGYVLLLGAVMLIAFYDFWSSSSYSGYGQGMPISSVRNAGLALAGSLAWTQAVLLAIVVPALTSSALTQELEKKTIEMLALTRLSAGKIVLGKQLSGFLYALVLLACSLPLSGICLMFGGVSPAEIATSYALLVTWAFMVTSSGVFWSSLFARSSTSSLFAYGSCGIYMWVTYYFGETLHPSGHHYGGPPGTFIFGVANPGWGVTGALVETKVCGIDVPVAAAAAGLQIALGALMLVFASTHVKHHIVERALPIRLLVLGITAALGWLLVGNMPALGGGVPARYVPDVFAVAATPALVLLMIGASMFATGELRNGGRKPQFAYGLQPWRVFKSHLGGSILFMLLWGAVAYAVASFTLYWAASSVTADFLGKCFEVAVAGLAVVFSASCVGVLASAIFRLRKNAAGLVILFGLLMFLGYLIVLAYWQNGISDPSLPVWQLAVFWPMTPIIVMAEGWRSMPKLWCGAENAWLACAIAHAAIGALCLALLPAAAAKWKGVQEE